MFNEASVSTTSSAIVSGVRGKPGTGEKQVESGHRTRGFLDRWSAGFWLATQGYAETQNPARLKF